MIRSVFMGTPAAAVPSLNRLSEVSHVELVVTRPDRPQGRNRRSQASPVKQAAVQLGLEVAEPSSASEMGKLLATLAAPDVGVVAAFGMILRPETLSWPGSGFLNVHFSLLPRWRGAAPVERAIMAGDFETGVTIIEMDEGLDTGPVVSQVATPIAGDENGGELTERLAELGARLMAETVPAWVEGSLVSTAQPEEGATYASRLESRDRRLSPEMDRHRFIRTVRAMAPRPGAQLEIDDQPHKILAVWPVDNGPGQGGWAVVGGTPVLGVGDGAIVIRQIQPPGKRPMGGDAWLRGRRGRLPG